MVGGADILKMYVRDLLRAIVVGKYVEGPAIIRGHTTF